MAYNTIHLAGNFRREEGLGYETTLPGKLVHLIEVSGIGRWRQHNHQGGYGEAAFAVEDALQGKTIDDAYTADDLFSVNICEKGAVVYAWLQAGQNVHIGDFLSSAGDGTLEEPGSGGGVVLAIALEDVDASGSAGANTRIKVRIV